MLEDIVNYIDDAIEESNKYCLEIDRKYADGEMYSEEDWYALLKEKGFRAGLRIARIKVLSIEKELNNDY